MIWDLIGIEEFEFNSFMESYKARSCSSAKYMKISDFQDDDKEAGIKIEKYLNAKLRLKFGDKLSGYSTEYGAFSGKSIFKQIDGHATYQYILKMDIKNFYDHLKFKLVEKEVKCLLEDNEKELIEPIYFLSGSLLRGLINSPLIAELYLLKLDNFIKGEMFKRFKKESRAHYSRYYDDMFISCDSKEILNTLMGSVSKKIESDGLMLNTKKSKIVSTKNTKVLGLNFNNGCISPPRRIKQLIYKDNALYDSMSEDDKNEVREKMSRAGTIKGYCHYIINNSTKPDRKYGLMVEYYGIEISRLHEKILRLLDT